MSVIHGLWIGILILTGVINGESRTNSVQCPRLPKLWNGDVIESCLRIVGSQCRFTCKKPYVLQGSENRTCLENATWSGESPSCELEGGQCLECKSIVKFEKQVATSCPSLLPPNGGSTRGTCNPGQVGSSCIFSCSGQTILVGQPVLVCLPSGAWSDSPPTCGGGTGASGTCRALTPPPGGRLVGSCSTAVTGDICQLVCISGFRPSDTRVLVCQPNGIWSDALPTCIGSGAQCPSIVVPQAILSGTCNPGIPGQSCTITCRSGFTLVGSTTITCQQTGTWSGQIPTCTVPACPALVPSPNSVTSGSCTQASIGQTCTFTCTPGFQLVGQSTLVCLPGSTWSSNPPTCRLACPSLFPPNNGALSGSCSQASAGQTCSFACLPGYALSGQQTLVCGPNGQWSSPTPTCTRTGCPALPIPTYGFQSGSCNGAAPGQSCVFSCQPGYQLVGQSTLICQNSGAWSGGVPTCARSIATCPTLVAISNGFVIGTCAPGQVGQSCVFGCNQNFVLEGQRTLVCQANGMWNGNLPRCVSSESEGCPTLFPPANGEFVECDNRIGGRCVVNCLRGYIRSGSRVRTCLQQGTWSGFAPVCTRRPVIGYRVVPLWSFLFG